MNTEFALHGCKLYLDLERDPENINFEIDQWLEEVYTANRTKLETIFGDTNQANVFEKYFKEALKIAKQKKVVKKNY